MGGVTAARLPEIVRVLASAGFEVAVQPTTEPGHATALAADACRLGGCEVVFGLGGDGTLREIAVALIGKEVPLAILPGGTTNVLALALGVPANPLRAAELYGATEARALDVGTAAGIPFLMMMTAGIDSEVLRRVSQASKKRFGRLAVAAQALAAMRAYDAPIRTMVAGDRRATGSFVVGQQHPLLRRPVRDHAARRSARRAARLRRVLGEGRLAMLELALDVVTGTHLSRGDFATWKGTSARLEGDGEAWVQIDGDPLRLTLPIEIALAPSGWDPAPRAAARASWRSCLRPPRSRQAAPYIAARNRAVSRRA